VCRHVSDRLAGKFAIPREHIGHSVAVEFPEALLLSDKEVRRHTRLLNLISEEEDEPIANMYRSNALRIRAATRDFSAAATYAQCVYRMAPQALFNSDIEFSVKRLLACLGIGHRRIDFRDLANYDAFRSPGQVIEIRNLCGSTRCKRALVSCAIER
jgi:hypothetical protein